MLQKISCKILLLIALTLLNNCNNKFKDEELITPPNFNEIPKDEDITQNSNDKNNQNKIELEKIENLKNILNNEYED